MDLRLHHIGIAVPDVSTAAGEYERHLGCRLVGGLIHDPVQTVYAQFLRFPGDSTLIELIAPDGPASALQRAVKKGGGLNHLCHSTNDIEAACRSLWDKGWVIIREPTPAVAFPGRRIAWLLAANQVLTELIEREPLDPSAPDFPASPASPVAT